ncbi:MAG: hypothetical protein PHO89_09905 [Methylacidiphilaceae bacterium]|nr:hypothetical protein [Candidatus Methylacidiphilaceae bacterium]
MKTVDPKVFAEALKIPEGQDAMDLACRWSTQRPDSRTLEGNGVPAKPTQPLARQFATLPHSVLLPLIIWKSTVGGPHFQNLPDNEQNQILDTEDALTAGFFLERLTPEQREAIYELQDLEDQQTIWAKKLPKSEYPNGAARELKECYELFTRWGPEKFRHMLEGAWSAKVFLQSFEMIFTLEGGRIRRSPKTTYWKLSKMPSWFWEEIAEFAKGPNFKLAISLFPPVRPILIGASSQADTLIALKDLARGLHDQKMMAAVRTVEKQMYAEAGFSGND